MSSCHMDLPSKLVFIDVETSGTRTTDRIIELGLVRVENNKIVSTYQTLLNPHCFIPQEIVTLTGINPAQLEAAPTFGQVKKDILELLDDSVFVAHNVRFDYNFLRNEFQREEISFRSKHFCTVKLSRTLFPSYRHHNLDSLIQRFGFDCKNRHRALDDAKVLWQFYEYILKNFSKELLEKAVNFVLKQPTRPVNIDKHILDDLPEKSGVYIFYGQNGMPLYIGKSVNIRDRVLSHFSSDKDSSTESKIAQQIESIETIETAGELGALFTECMLIKKMQPLYNRKLRHSKMMMVLKKVVRDGYACVDLDTADTIDVDNISDVLGVFRNKKSAKQFLIHLAKKYCLCEKLLGLDTTLKTCFGYRLGKCKGACVQKEITAKYNLRFFEAFSSTKLQPWPFEGPILIEEKSPLSGLAEGFLLDKWCLLGSTKNNHNNLFTSDLPTTSEYHFDVDTYKILLSYLYTKSSKIKINILKNNKNPNLISYQGN